MRRYIEKIKRGFAREMSCVNMTVVAICACCCASLVLIFAMGGIDLEVYGDTLQPGFYLPPFFLVLASLAFYALFGAAAGIIISTPYYRKDSGKLISLTLAVCTLLLSFAWIPLVYTAASFFVAALLYLAVLIFCGIIFKFYFEVNPVAAWAVLVFAFFAFYLVCYSLSLFFIN